MMQRQIGGAAIQTILAPVKEQIAVLKEQLLQAVAREDWVFVLNAASELRLMKYLESVKPDTVLTLGLINAGYQETVNPEVEKKQVRDAIEDLLREGMTDVEELVNAIQKKFGNTVSRSTVVGLKRSVMRHRLGKNPIRNRPVPLSSDKEDEVKDYARYLVMEGVYDPAVIQQRIQQRFGFMMSGKALGGMIGSHKRWGSRIKARAG